MKIYLVTEIFHHYLRIKVLSKMVKNFLELRFILGLIKQTMLYASSMFHLV